MKTLLVVLTLCLLSVSLITSELVLVVEPGVIIPGETAQLVINCSMKNHDAEGHVYSSLSLYRYNDTKKEYDLLLAMKTKDFNASQFAKHKDVHISSGKFFAALIKKIPTQSDAQVYKCLVVGETFIISEKKLVKYNPIIKLNKTNLGNAELVMDVKPSVINFGFTPQLVINCSLTINTVLEGVHRSISLYRYNVTQKEFDLLLTMDTKTMNVKQTVEHKDVHITSGSMFAALIKVNAAQSDAQVYKCL
ncbi:fibrinogen-related protein 3.3, partial [Biomphalaria glabrata]